MSIQMYIASSFASDPNRVGGIWATGVDASNNITSYPIVEFAGGSFQGWDSSGSGSWIALGVPSGFMPDSWHTLSMTLDTSSDTLAYAVDGQELGSSSADGTIQFANVILQGINPGIDRTLYFDNLAAAAPSTTPLPAALPLFGSVIGAGLWVQRRRKARASTA